MATSAEPQGAPAARQLDVYPAMRLQRLGSIAVVQPVAHGEVVGLSLTCDLETGSLALSEHPKVDKGYTPVFGVLGLLKLDAGPALVVVTGVEEVGPGSCCCCQVPGEQLPDNCTTILVLLFAVLSSTPWFLSHPSPWPSPLNQQLENHCGLR